MAADEGHQEDRRPGDDPTAEFLASVRPGDTPWRVDRPADEQHGGEAAPGTDPQPERWHRARAVARAAGQAAPFVQGAAFGALAAGALAESRPEDADHEAGGGTDLSGLDGSGG